MNKLNVGDFITVCYTFCGIKRRYDGYVARIIGDIIFVDFPMGRDIIDAKNNCFVTAHYLRKFTPEDFRWRKIPKSNLIKVG